MPNGPTGTIDINESPPYTYGDFLNFTTTSSHLGGGHPMVEVAGYQDLNGDGVITLELFSADPDVGSDLGSIALNQPGTPVWLPNAEHPQQLDVSQPAKFKARLLNYGWKGKQEYINELAAVEFDVVP